MQFKKVLNYVVSASIAAGLLWYVFKDINLPELWKKFEEANYAWVALSAVLALVAHWSRAYRWKLMLQPLGYNPSAFKTTLAVLNGYLINLVFPRAGEFARCGTLQRLEGIPFEKSFGAVIAERMIDVLMLLLLIFLSLILEFDRISGLFFELMGDKFKNPTLLIGVAVAGVFFILTIIFLFKTLQPKLSKQPFYQKIASVLEGLWGGFTSIRNLKNPMAFVGHTLLIWLLYYLMTYFLCFALPETRDLTPLAGLTILVMGSIGMAAPTVGGIGSYHFLVGRIVMLYGLSQQAGITLATFLHFMQGILFVIVFGFFSFLAVLFLEKNKTRDQEFMKTS